VYFDLDPLSSILISTLIIILIWFSNISAMDQQDGTAQIEDTGFVPYSNPTFWIRIQYPADWGRLDLSFLQNNSADINFYPLDDPSGSLSVRIQVESMLRSQNMTLDEYSRMKVNSARGQLLESNSTILANLPAREIVIDSSVLKTLQVWALKGDKVFTITYQAEEEDFQNDLPIAKKMIESFEIT
jgi:eukaryotic-like serine/threonine-protein kinase